MAQNLPRGTPGRVLVLLTLLTGLVAVSAWRDALRRETDAWVSHPTAVGDGDLLRPEPLPARLMRRGKALSLQAAGPPSARRDDRMFRVLVGAGAELPFSLFTAREHLEAEADPKIYARLAPGQFVRLRVSVASGPSAPAAARSPAALAPAPGRPEGTAEGAELSPFSDTAPPAGTL